MQQINRLWELKKAKKLHKTKNKQTHQNPYYLSQSADLFQTIILPVLA